MKPKFTLLQILSFIHYFLVRRLQLRLVSIFS